METLNVYLNGKKAGCLRDANGRMDFVYLPEYLAELGNESCVGNLTIWNVAFRTFCRVW